MLPPAASAFAVALAVALLFATVAVASGGNSIAGAPTLPLGQVTAGGGAEQEFWRLQLYGGDRVTFIADLGENPDYSREWGFALYAPSVTDYTIRVARAADQAVARPGKTEFAVTSPFSGLGTLDVCEGGLLFKNPCGVQELLAPQADPYSFTATVVHATSVQVSVPTLALAGSIVTVRASVQSPAGTPAGSCLIQGRIASLNGGRCSRRVRLGHGRRQTIQVEFVGSEGWQTASSNRAIRLLP